MDAVKLSKKSMQELIALRTQTENKGRIPPEEVKFWLYDRKTRKALDELGWAIYYKLQERRKNETTHRNTTL
jgi:hypothetical protein